MRVYPQKLETSIVLADGASNQPPLDSPLCVLDACHAYEKSTINQVRDYPPLVLLQFSLVDEAPKLPSNGTPGTGALS
jgi:hypothetical protein